MKKIPLTKGYETIVDDDFEPERRNGLECKYHADIGRSGKGKVYAARSVRGPDGKRHNQYLHREILGLEPGDPRQVDHINGDTLDNRRENLRVCTRVENARNARCHIDNTTGYKGVYYDKFFRKYRAQIRLNGKHKSLGCFTSAVDAAHAYDAAARDLFGEFARLNFSEVAL